MHPSHILRSASRSSIPMLLAMMTALAVFLSPRQAMATTYYVTTTGSNFNTGLSWSSPMVNLQATIHAAKAGDQIWVKTGTYTGALTTVDGVALYGGFAGTETSITQRNISAHPTILNGASLFTPILTVDSASVMTVVIDGFTIENGMYGGIYDASGDTLTVANCTISSNTNYSSEYGGGIYTSGTAALTNTTFTGNNAYYGGGVYTTGGATLSGCTFSTNSASYYGGGVYTTNSATFTNCAFNTNTAGSGGGVDVNSSATFTNCTFSTNSASDGGGIASEYNTSLIMTGCSLTSNTAGTGYGGGVYSYYSTASIKTSTFTTNTAGYGGALYAVNDSALTLSQSTLTGNAPDAGDLEGTGVSGTPALIKDNLIVGTGPSATGPDGFDLDVVNGGITYVTISNNTIALINAGIFANSSDGDLSVANNIFFDSYGALNDVGILGPVVVSSHNAFYGNIDYDYLGALYGTGDETVNPMFATGAGGYHLASGSPLINAGDNSYVVSGDKDRDGNARIQGSQVDIGAYEAPSGLTITSFTPTSGASGTSVTITGTGFTGATVVAFNGAAAATFHVVSSTQITATVPASAATGPLSVTTSAGMIYSGSLFTVPAPAPASFTPTSGPVGTTVVITGTNFTGVTVVGFTGAHASFTVNSPTQITATVPAGALTGKITIASPAGSGQTTGTFTVTSSPAPKITSFAGTSGSVGTSVTITGSNFMSVNAVSFGGMEAKYKVVSMTDILAVVPSGAVTGAIKVATPLGTATSAGMFTVLTAPHLTTPSPLPHGPS